MIRALAITIAGFAFNTANAQNFVPYAGQWHLHSSGGYHGSLTLDGIGGCSYFLTSAFLTVQATCVIRELDDGTLMIFGSQEGSSTVAPAYGEQLTTSRQTNVPQTVVNMMITEIDSQSMRGKLLAGGRDETISLSR